MIIFNILIAFLLSICICILWLLLLWAFCGAKLKYKSRAMNIIMTIPTRIYMHAYGYPEKREKN